MNNSTDELLNIRIEPLQKRSKETVDLILRTALDLLCEVGGDALTTKLLAERAQIRVRNIYRYFPNKFAIFSALAQRMAENELVILNDFQTIRNLELSVSEAWSLTIDSFIKAAISEPGMLEVRIAMQGNPELRTIDEKHKAVLTGKLSDAFLSRGIMFSNEKLHLICTIILDTTNALLNRAIISFSDSKDESKILEMVEEIKWMLNMYIDSYFGD